MMIFIFIICLSVCLSGTFYPKFPIYHHDKVWDAFSDLYMLGGVCVSVSYISSLPFWVVCLRSRAPEARSETLSEPANVPTLTVLRPDQASRRPAMASWSYLCVCNENTSLSAKNDLLSFESRKMSTFCYVFSLLSALPLIWVWYMCSAITY